MAALEALVGDPKRIALNDAAIRQLVSKAITTEGEIEVAFYDALAVNESAVTAMGDDKLKLTAPNSSPKSAKA